MRFKMLLKRVLICFFILGASVNAEAYTFAWETISGSRVGGAHQQFGWNYSYDIGFYNDTLMVDVDIMLIDVDKMLDNEASSTIFKNRMNRWESGIETMWTTTDRFSVPIEFNVDWVTSDYDQRVWVHNLRQPADMINWYITHITSEAYHEEMAAHEFGHMLSLYDEYATGAVNYYNPIIKTGGLMHTLNGSTLNYYYDPFLNWYKGKVDAYQAGIGATVPEPATLLLFAVGMTVLAGARLRKKK